MHLYGVYTVVVHPELPSIVSSSHDDVAKCIHVTALDDEHALPDDDDESSLYRRALDVDSGNVEMLCECAEHLYSREHYDGVVSLCRRALQKNPTHNVLLVLKGNALGAKGDYDEAIVTYKEALEANSNNVEILKALNDTYEKQRASLCLEIKELKQAAVVSST